MMVGEWMGDDGTVDIFPSKKYTITQLHLTERR